MQAMAMINQPAPVNDAVAARAARSTGKGVDSAFSPALQKACNDCSDEELAGAAMVSQGDSTQQQVATEAGGAVQEQPEAGEKGIHVAVAEMITAKALTGGQAESVASPIGEGEEVAQVTVSVASVATEVEGDVDNVVAATVGRDRTVLPNNQLLNAEDVRGGNHQQQNVVDGSTAETLIEAAQSTVASKMAKVNGATAAVTAQAVAVVSEGNPNQKLNVQPLEQVVEIAASVEAVGAEKVKGGRPVVTDPRFASLLNKPELGATLRQQQGVDPAIVAPMASSVVAPSSEVAGATANLIVGDDGIVLSQAAESLVGADSLGVAATPTQQPESAMSGAVQPQVTASGAVSTPGSEVSIPLKDGSTLPESRVVQQTIDHLTLHARGDSSSVTVKLHPEELGELQLRMVMEGDQLKVHLQAQTQQVQEVLERNFPRLRDALQDQGVTVEDFQVSVDSGERGDQQSSERGEFVANRQSDQFSSFDQDNEPEVEAVISAAAAQADGRGVSLRV